MIASMHALFFLDKVFMHGKNFMFSLFAGLFLASALPRTPSRASPPAECGF
jgi:hypothetical protein